MKQTYNKVIKSIICLISGIILIPFIIIRFILIVIGKLVEIAKIIVNTLFLAIEDIKIRVVRVVKIED